MGSSPEFDEAVSNPPDSAELHAHALERLAGDIRRHGLLQGHMRATAEVEEGEPVIKDGVAWENNRPTGRVLYQLELLIDRKANTDGDGDGATSGGGSGAGAGDGGSAVPRDEPDGRPG